MTSVFLLDYKIIVRIAWRFGFFFVHLHSTQLALKGERGNFEEKDVFMTPTSFIIS